jgi:O-antigen ligase
MNLIKVIYPYLALLPFLFPFVYKIKIPVKDWGSLNGLDLILTLIIFLGLIIIYKNQQWLNFIKFLNQSFFKKIGLFLIIILISSIFNLNSNWIHQLSLLKSFFFLPISFGVLMTFFLKKKFLNYWYFFYSYLIYSLFLGLFTISFKFFNLTTFDNRVKLFFDSPNQLAVALSLGIISNFLLIKNRNKSFFWGLLILIPALLLTKSAGSILAILIISIIYFSKDVFRKKRLILKTILIISFIFLINLFFLPTILQKINYNPFENKNSFDSRLVIYSVTAKIIPENLLNGIGINGFQNQYLKKQVLFPPYPQWAVPHSHNLLTQILISFGIWGLFFWTVLILKSKNPLNQEIFYLFLFYFLIHGLVDVPIWNNDQALFFWFIMVF